MGGSVQYTGIIGNPLGHSLSPLFQQAAFDHLDLDIKYELFPTDIEDLEKKINSLRALNYLGANVTIPYKTDVIPFLDELDETANSIGAVNTILNKGGRLIGYNTDGLGFIRAVSLEAKIALDKIDVLIVGAGGSARAVLVALLKENPSSVVVANRSRDRADILVESVHNFNEIDVQAIGLTTIEQHLLNRDFDLIVNCTSLGMKGGLHEDGFAKILDYVNANTIVYDLVYNPRETPLMVNAKKESKFVFNGLEMLIQQGAASFQIWTEKEAPVHIMRKAIQETLYN